MGNGFNAAELLDPLFSAEDQEPGDRDRPEEAQNHSFEPEQDPLASFLQQIETLPSESREKDQVLTESNPFLASFLTDLIPSIKNQLGMIRNLTSLSADRLGDLEFRKSYQRNITDRIRQIDSVLNSLLNYIHINTPVMKQNTLHIILEEVLEANEKQLQEKNIRVFKKGEKDLPETHIHDEQVKFILNALLQYVILSTLPNGSIGFLLRASDTQNGEGQSRSLIETNGGSIEILIGFTTFQKSTAFPGTAPPSSKAQKEEIIDLILKLVEEILAKNHGGLSLEVDEKRSKSAIVLKLPIERRKVVFYERINL